MNVKIPWIILPVAGLAIAGCGPKHPESSDLTIIPGVGIVGVVEVGKTPAEIARLTRDLLVEGAGPYTFFVPSLGACWEQETRTGLVPKMDFDLDSSYLAQVYPGTRMRPFRGSIRNQLSCRREGELTRDRIVSVFGSPVEHTDLGNPVSRVKLDELNRTYLTGRATSMPAGVDTEVMYYPLDGIHFIVRGNLVWRISIVPKIKPGGAANGSQPIRSATNSTSSAAGSRR